MKIEPYCTIKIRLLGLLAGFSSYILAFILFLILSRFDLFSSFFIKYPLVLCMDTCLNHL